MSEKPSLLIRLILLSVLLSSGLACGKFSGSAVSDNRAKSGNYIYEIPPATPTKSATPKIEKADYTMTAKELVEEFMREGAASADLKKKYAGKNIAVSGRVTMFSFEPDGTAPPYVVLSAPEAKRGVTCYAGDSKDTARQIRKDKFVTMQGTMSEFPMAGTTPSLGECFVLKAD